MIMDLNSPSNASLVLEKLREEEAIQLYPKEKPLTEAEQYIKDMQAFYEEHEGVESAKLNEENRDLVKEAVRTELLTAGLYNTFVEPVCESLLATTREKDVAYNIIKDHVVEEGVGRVIFMESPPWGPWTS
jgi:hypothetical protein